ncbi:hypothetical protein BJ742DRAFT_873513 [Cladochytrium replicatum]|nr:hypothetical protein BJ742DRAFT_873513 [Cladochytrium replicatum]
MASACWENPLSAECRALPLPYTVVVLTYTAVFLLPALIRYGGWKKAHLPKHYGAGYLPVASDDERPVDDFADRWETFEEDVDLRSRQASIASGKFKPNFYIGAPLFATLGALLAGSVLSAYTTLVAFGFAFSFVIAAISFFYGTTFSEPEPAALFEHDKRQRRNVLLALGFYFLITIAALALFPIESALAKVAAAVSVGLFALTAFYGLHVFKLGKLELKLVDGIHPSPEKDTSFFSWIIFSWYDPMMRFGSQNKIEVKDIWGIPTSLVMANSMSEYSKLSVGTKTVVARFWNYGRWLFLVQWTLVVLSSLLYFSGSFFLQQLLGSIESPGDRPEWYPYFIVTMLFVATMVQVGTDNGINTLGRHLSLRFRNVLLGLIYTKSLRRSIMGEVKKDGKEGSDTASVGKIVNLMGKDATTVGEFSAYLYYPVATGVQIVLCVIYLLILLGPAALTGVFTMVALMFAGTPLAQQMNNYFQKLSSATDDRATAVNEMLQAMRIVKFYAWEPQFRNRIDNLRKNELNMLITARYISTATRIFWVCAPIIVSFVTFFTFTKLAGGELTATTAFTALSLFALLREPLQAFPETLVQLIDAWVSFKRIITYLDEPDLDKYSESHKQYRAKLARRRENGEALPVVGLKDGTFAWKEKEAEKETNGAAKVAKPLSITQRVKSWFVKTPATAAAETSSAVVVEEEAKGFELSGVDITVPLSKLTVVCGATASGKSSVLMAILGEMYRVAGDYFTPNEEVPSFGINYANLKESAGLSANGPVAFVSQQAWLLNATVRDNILFGKDYDEERYRKVLFACSLEKDLETLEGGDMTEIGEKGINLSGGQKQRISLARAAYSDCQYIFLDDCLSAVDAPTARHLLQHCILGLMASRTRVLVTNATSLCLPRADHIVVLVEGTVAVQGSLDELFADDKVATLEAADAFSASIVASKELLYLERNKGFVSEEQAEAKSGEEEADGDKAKKGKLTKEEKVEEGKVDMKVYKFYLSAFGGIPALLILIAGYSTNHVFTLLMDYWVRIWSDQYSKPSADLFSTSAFTDASQAFYPPSMQNPYLSFNGSTSPAPLVFQQSSGFISSDDQPEVDVNYYLTVYGLLGIGTMCAISFRLIYLIHASVNAGRRVHERFLDSLLRAPIRFFETTPIGQIMNRVTKDTRGVDWMVSTVVANSVHAILYCLFVLIMVSLFIPGLIIAIFPIGYMYYKIGAYYIGTARTLRRLESVTRSPLFSLFTETLNGVVTVRAYSAEARFTSEFYKRTDIYNRSTYNMSVAQQWLSTRIQFISQLVVLATGISLIAAKLSAGTIGLCLTYTMSLNFSLGQLVYMVAMFETGFNSVERIREYLEIDHEKPDVIEDNRPPEGWPTAGHVFVDKLSMKYAKDLPLVLKEVTMDIPAKSKVGVVGRTGAGKSSLATAFFRLVEADSGRIVIDGVDIGAIGLRDLRSKLVMLPQDAVLFTGTVRSNLDPFGTVDDATLNNSLQRAHVVRESGTITSSESDEESRTDDAATLRAGAVKITLDTEVKDGGGNFSHGQKQLLCLARALIRQSKVIILDEATASVDHETDTRIQQTIRTEMAGATVLTIAHRLKTIADYDLVAVMDSGAIAEFAHPYDLMTREDSIFRSMCLETGEFDELLSLARAAKGLTTDEC